MYIAEESPTQLIIKSKRGMMAIAMTLFVIFSLFTVVMIFMYGLQMLAMDFTWWRLLGYLVWQPLSIALVVVGIMFWNNAMRGLEVTFDRQAESVTIRQPKILRMKEQHHSIYSIQRMEMEHIPEARMFAVYIVTKASEKIPIGSVSHFDEEATRDLVKQVRLYLNHRPA